MAIPEELLPNVLAYCQDPAPDAADLMVLNQAWDAAGAFLAGAGISEPEPDDLSRPIWLQVMCALTLDGYDQRGAQFDAGNLAENPTWQRMKNQLKFDALPVPEESTGGVRI